MIASDVEPIPTCTRAIAALNGGHVDEARKLMIQAAREHQDLRDDHARLTRRVTDQSLRLKDFAALSTKPLEQP